MSDTLNLAIALCLVLLNGFFVAAEFALVRVRSTRIQELAEEGKAQARVAHRIVNRLDAYLSATQLGVTVASIALGALGEPALANLIHPALRLVGIESKAVADVFAVSIGLVVVTFLHVVFGELAPKWTAIQRPESIA